MIAETGSIFTKDAYQFYEVDWETVGGDLDITTITKIPFVWGEAPSGFVKNGILFRWGMITVQRQILRFLTDGYEIIAEGSSSFEDFIQMNFPCEAGPTDPFAYHVDCNVLDETYIKILEGPHWADPDDSDDADAIWGDLEDDGDPVSELTLTGGADILEWVDVWA